MPMIIFTHEHIEQLRTPAGGFNQAAMEVIGNWPLHAGWYARLLGTKVSDRKWRQAVNAAKRGPVHRFRGNTRRG